jgi:hypothetical protein
MGTLKSEVDKALKMRDTITPSDAGIAALALTYAEAIDEGDDLKSIGPLLQKALETLLMSPRARSEIMRGENSGSQVEQAASPIDEIRKRRAARARISDTENMDSAAT